MPAELARAHRSASRRAASPNYFGEQRFGRDAGNLAAGAAHRASARRKRAARASGAGATMPGFMLSAARSVIFNAHPRGARGAGHLESTGCRRCRESRRPRQRVRRGRGRCRTRATLRRARRASHGAAARARASRWPPARCWRSKSPSSAQFPEALAVISRRRHEFGTARVANPRPRSRARISTATCCGCVSRLSAGSFATTVLREIIAGAATGE